MPGLPLSLYEREEIAVALIEDLGVAWAVIGRRVGRHPTTIASEVAAGGGRAATGRQRCRSRLRAPGADRGHGALEPEHCGTGWQSSFARGVPPRRSGRT